jgi:hypothetical protein
LARYVIGAGDAVVIALVTAEAVPGQAGKLVVYMAVIAGNICVSPAKLKPARLNVIERPVFPTSFSMANGAILRKTQQNMRRRSAVPERLRMAAITFRGSSGVSRNVAAITVGPGMRAPQLERLDVNVSCILPLERRRLMAGLAIQGKVCLLMIGIYRLREIA